MNPHYAGVVGLALTLLPAVAHAQDCPSLVEAVDQISSALQQVEIERAQELATTAYDGIACQPEPVNPVTLAGLFQLIGAVAVFAGETADADAAFARAVAISPMATIDSIYGSDVEQLYQQVQRRLLDEAGGSLLVRGSAAAWLDGRTVTMGVPVDLVVGQHLLQWQLEDGPMQSREIRVVATETRQLTLGELSDEELRQQMRANRGGIDPNLPVLIGGGVGLAAGAVLLGLASRAEDSLHTEEDPDALAGIQARNHAFALSGAGLLAVGAGAAGISFFVHDAPGVRVAVRF
jgi:hypothetical protein